MINSKLRASEIIFGISLISMISTRLNLNVGFALTPVYFVNIIMVWGLMFSKRAFLTRNSILALSPIVLFYLYSICTSFYAPDFYSSFRFLIGSIFFILTIFIHIAFYHSFSVRGALVLSRFSVLYIILSFISYILGMLLYSRYPEGSKVFGVLVEKGIPRAIGIVSDPNFAGLTFGIMLIVLLHSFSKVSVYVKFIAVLLILATLSRGALFSIVLTFILFNFRFSRNSVKYFIFFVFVVLMLWFLYNESIYFTNLIDKRIAGASGGGGRFDMWRDAIQLFDMAPIFGHGIFNFRYLNQTFFNDYHYAHNTYLEVIIETGVVGFAFYSAMIGNLFVLAFYSKYRDVSLKILVLVCVMATSLSMYLNPTFIFIILVIYTLFVEGRFHRLDSYKS